MTTRGIAVIAGSLVLLTVGGLWIHQRGAIKPRTARGMHGEPGDGVHDDTAALQNAIASATPIRFAWPHALAKYGVSSPEEFEALRLSDPVLEKAWAGIGHPLTPMHIPAETSMYAMFRDGDHVSWTSRKIPVHKGELFFVDPSGNMIRASCGNVMAYDLPVRPSMPTPPEMDSPAPRVEMPVDTLPPSLMVSALVPLPEVPVMPEAPEVSVPVSEPSMPGVPFGPDVPPDIAVPPAAAGIPPGIFIPVAAVPLIPVISGGGGSPPPAVAALTPEPGTLMLGALAMLWLLRRLRGCAFLLASALTAAQPIMLTDAALATARREAVSQWRMDVIEPVRIETEAINPCVMGRDDAAVITVLTKTSAIVTDGVRTEMPTTYEYVIRVNSSCHWTQEFLNHVITHEWGHIFLGARYHNADKRSIMYRVTWPDRNQKVTREDRRLVDGRQ